MKGKCCMYCKTFQQGICCKCCETEVIFLYIRPFAGSSLFFISFDKPITQCSWWQAVLDTFSTQLPEYTYKDSWISNCATILHVYYYVMSYGVMQSGLNVVVPMT